MKARTTLEMTLYVCLKKPYNKPLINLDLLVITGKYQTSAFYLRTSVWYFAALLVNKKLLGDACTYKVSVDFNQQSQRCVF